MGMSNPVHLWLYVHSVSFCPGNKDFPKCMQLQLFKCVLRCIKLIFHQETSWKEPLCATFPSSMMIITSAALQYCNWLVVISTAFPLRCKSTRRVSTQTTPPQIEMGPQVQGEGWQWSLFYAYFHIFPVENLSPNMFPSQKPEARINYWHLRGRSPIPLPLRPGRWFLWG